MQLITATQEVCISARKLVVLLQDYVPQYRVPLFNALAEELRARSIEFIVCHGVTPASEAQMRDDATSGSWSRPVELKWATVAGHSVVMRRLPPEIVRGTDAWIAPLRAGDLDAWRLVARGRPVILWGHGKHYVNDASPAADSAELILLKRARHLFAYAPGGKRALEARGVPRERVTVVGNAADGPVLRAAVTRYLPNRECIAQAFGVDGRQVALAVGALDESKRTPFLVAAAEEAYRLDSNFLLVVGGSGPDASRLWGLPFIRHLGRVDSHDKARWGAVADAVWNPGRVGLIMLDAMALGLPLLTTHYPWHAPELEFAITDKSVFYLPNDPAAFARAALAHIVKEPRDLSGLVESPERVAARMVGPLLRVLEDGDLN
jgi:glycosyltransferase involved in cell wall biosynthesis